jgi:hypothetical protein
VLKQDPEDFEEYSLGIAKVRRKEGKGREMSDSDSDG